MAHIDQHGPDPVGQEMLDARLGVVVEHMEAEACRDIDRSLATFARPRYEMPGEEVIDGSAAVAEHLRQLFTGFPDLAWPPLGAGTTLHHAGDSVVMQSRLQATHTGSLGGLPPTGHRIDIPVVAFFDFEGAALVCERVFFDRLAMLGQLRMARDPNTVGGRVGAVLNHPVTLARAAVRSTISRRARTPRARADDTTGRIGPGSRPRG